MARPVGAEARQRRSLDELQGDLFLDVGSRREKTSACWALLLLATVIAAGGVIGSALVVPLGLSTLRVLHAALAGPDGDQNLRGRRTAGGYVP